MKPAQCLVACSAVLALACNRADDGSTASSAPSASASAPPAVSASVPAAPWYAGTWQATASAERHRIALEPKLGGPKQWEEEEGETATGPMNLTITITPEGVARGDARGALGPLQGAGAIDGEVLTMQWAGEGEGFNGVLSARREGQRLTGTLQSSSGDSLTVRSAKIVLEKK